MHSIQSQKLSNFQKHQEGGFRAIKREEKQIDQNKNKRRLKHLPQQEHKHRHTHIYIYCLSPSGLYGTHPFYDNDQ